MFPVLWHPAGCVGFLAAICTVAPASVPQLLFLKGLLLPSACQCPFHCEVSFPHPVTIVWIACCKALIWQRRPWKNHGGSRSYRWPTPWLLSLPSFVAANEHSKSKAEQLASSTPPKLFFRQPVHSGTFSLLHFVCSLPHFQRMSVCNVSGGWGEEFCEPFHFGDRRDGQSNLLFFTLNCAFGKQVAIEYTHTISLGKDSGTYVNIWQSHEIKPSQAFYQWGTTTWLLANLECFPETGAYVKTSNTAQNDRMGPLIQMGRARKPEPLFHLVFPVSSRFLYGNRKFVNLIGRVPQADFPSWRPKRRTALLNYFKSQDQKFAQHHTTSQN